MSVNSLVNTVQTYLASNHMYVDDEWLSGCVEYLTEGSSTNYNETQIQNLAKEQWLLNDLKDICPGSLPVNLNNQHKTVLDGRFVVQINAAIDIGTPAYQQYLKLQKVNQENIEVTTKFDDKVPSHRVSGQKVLRCESLVSELGVYLCYRSPGHPLVRKKSIWYYKMIKLHLTDGVQELSAIEYKPMRNLSCDITPGCKVLLKGPIECRRGVLLLTESAIELLGGEVQEIVVSNSLAGLLSSKLGLPITQEPDHNTTISLPRNTNIPTPHTEMPSSRPDDQPYDSYGPVTSRPVAVVTSLQVANFTDDDFDVDQLAAIEAQINNSNKKPTNTRTETKLDPIKRQLSNTEANPEKRVKITPNNNEDDYPTENDLFLEDEDYLREVEAQFDAKECEIRNAVISSEPFIYIKQINDMRDIEKGGRVFRVKGQIIKLLSKIAIGKDGWSLRCTIVDGTGSIDVDFTSDVLSKLVGFTPQEMNQLKKQMATKPELKEKVVSGLQKAKDTLQVLYCIIELTMLEVPKITCLIPFEEEHVELLRKRQNSRL